MEPPPGFASEASYVLWQADVAEHFRPDDTDSALQLSRNRIERDILIERRKNLTDAELRRVAEQDPAPEARRLATAERARRQTITARKPKRSSDHV